MACEFFRNSFPNIKRASGECVGRPFAYAGDWWENVLFVSSANWNLSVSKLLNRTQINICEFTTNIK